MPDGIDDWVFKGESLMRKRRQKQRQSVLVGERLKEKDAVPLKERRGCLLRKTQSGFNSMMAVDIGDFRDDQMWANM
jgi:hypothetical protein